MPSIFKLFSVQIWMPQENNDDNATIQIIFIVHSESPETISKIDLAGQ